MLFYQKQQVIRSISRDIFQIKSDEISFSSEKIFILSEKIGKKSEEIAKCLRIRARLLGRMIFNSRRKHSFPPSLLEILTKIRLAI